MFHKILLPIDLTDKHHKALQIAAGLARPASGEVILLHVIEEIPGLAGEEEKDFYHRLEQKARAHLSGLATSLAQGKVACRSEVITGHRARDTVRFANAEKADLIILTSPPFQPQHPMPALGSMSWKISLLATCPVLLVKSEGDQQ